MKTNILIICVILGVIFIFTNHTFGQESKTQKNIQFSVNSNIEVITAMTLEEKAHFVVGNDHGFPRGYPSIFGGADTLFDLNPPIVGNTQQLVEGAAGTTFPITRLGIPAIVLADGPAGLRISPFRSGSAKTYYATAFPIASLLASTWDTSLVEEVGRAMGNEALEYGVDILLAPALNIQRNPLGGRNFEYYSEDPLISGSMATAMINGVQSNGVGTSIKHFAANNNETNRMTINVATSERALREIYLKGFRMAVQKSKPWTLMSAYNKINGIYCNENVNLLTTILRKEWLFNGFVMTDWFAGRDHIQQVVAGNDMIMPGSDFIANEIVNAVKTGQLDEKMLDKNVNAILNIIRLTPKYRKYKYTDHPDLKAHAEIAKKAAEGGMVLLKNKNFTLPFSNKVFKVAAFGNAFYYTVSGGTGSGDVNKAYNVSFAHGLADNGYFIDEQLKNLYSEYIRYAQDTLRKPLSFMDRKPVIGELLPDYKQILDAAKSSDIGILCISRTSGEFHDRLLKDDYFLTQNEQKLIKEVSNVFHNNNKKVVVILNIGGVIEISSWINEIDAILLAWQPGQEGGHAVANILSGKINPSGKLTTTFPINYSDVSSSGNSPSSIEDSPSEIKYKEGIYLGYRYYNTFNIKTEFEFGYGLSYTKFRVDNLAISEKNFHSQMKATVTITNIGKIAGKDVVQLYLKAPNKGLDKPDAELKAFVKSKLLQPGETQNIEFVIFPMDLASFDTTSTSWIAEEGLYELRIGFSSKQIECKSTFILKDKLIIEKDFKVFSSSNITEDLKAIN